MMSQMIEIKAGSVDEAVAKGLDKLGVAKDQVTVTVVDEGSSGLFGLGSRDAVVQLSLIEADAPTEETVEEVVEETIEEQVDVESEPEEIVPAVSADSPRSNPSNSDDAPPPLTLEELENERDIAVAYVSEIIEKMGIDASVSGIVNEADSMTGRRVVEVSVEGDNLKSLIGSRGETMESLQYLTRIMVGNDIRRRSNYLLDVGGSRGKRTQALQRMAERMADKAVSRGKRVTLEPMSSYERRIIHMALREDGRVRTESRGVGKDRRVVIVP